MKKCLLLTSLIVTIGQCQATTSVKQVEEQLTQLCNVIQTSGLSATNTQDFLSRTIDEITEYAILNSKNIMGQDMDLIEAATVIRDVNDSTIAAFATEDRGIKKGKLEDILSSARTRLLKQKEKVSRTFMTQSKKDAQQALQKTINFFISCVLTLVNQEWELLDKGAVR